MVFSEVSMKHGFIKISNFFFIITKMATEASNANNTIPNIATFYPLLPFKYSPNTFKDFIIFLKTNKRLLCSLLFSAFVDESSLCKTLIFGSNNMTRLFFLHLSLKITSSIYKKVRSSKANIIFLVKYH